MLEMFKFCKGGLGILGAERISTEGEMVVQVSSITEIMLFPTGTCLRKDDLRFRTSTNQDQQSLTESVREHPGLVGLLQAYLTIGCLEMKCEGLADMSAVTTPVKRIFCADWHVKGRGRKSSN